MKEELKKEWRDKLRTMPSYTEIEALIDFLLAKQQEEFVKIVKNRTGVIAYADTDKGTVERILISRDDLLADIKSKLNI
jgi:hypothetical protein